MKLLLSLMLGMSLLLVLSSCMGGPRMIPNPEFESCMKVCARTRNDCIVNATTSDNINSCNANQTGCAQSCEANYKRRIQAPGNNQ